MSSDPTSQFAGPTGSLGLPTWWQKPLIWGAFLVLLYLLREFFLIGFLTFLICFVIRGLVGFLIRRVAPNRESRLLELILTIVIFLAICVGLYGIGRYFVPQVIQQGKSLVTQIQNTSPEEVQNNLLANTIGKWQFQRQLGTPDDQRYQDAFRKYQETGRSGEGLYQLFPQISGRLQAEFEAQYEEAQVLHLQSSGIQQVTVNTQFEEWFLRVKASEILDQKNEYYLARWQADFVAPEKSGELATLKQRPDFESRRDQQICERILADVKADPVRLAEFENQWARAQSIAQWSEFRKSPEYQEQFETFYETRRQENPASAPFDFEFYQTLANAYPQGKEAFLTAVRQHYESDKDSLAHQRQDFETTTRLELGQQWWGNSHVADWFRDHAKSDGPKVARRIRRLGREPT